MKNKKSKIPVPSDLAHGFSESQNTEEVAVCRGLGVELVAGAECRKTYTKLNPYNSGRPEVIFNLNAASSTWETKPQGATGNAEPLKTQAIRQAYASDGSPAKELDDLIERIENKELRQQIKNILPLAYACYGRAFMQAKRDCMGYLKSAPDFIKGVNRNGKPYNINRKAREFAKRMNIQ